MGRQWPGRRDPTARLRREKGTATGCWFEAGAVIGQGKVAHWPRRTRRQRTLHTACVQNKHVRQRIVRRSRGEGRGKRVRLRRRTGLHTGSATPPTAAVHSVSELRYRSIDDATPLLCHSRGYAVCDDGWAGCEPGATISSPLLPQHQFNTHTQPSGRCGTSDEPLPPLHANTPLVSWQSTRAGRTCAASMKMDNTDECCVTRDLDNTRKGGVHSSAPFQVRCMPPAGAVR